MSLSKEQYEQIMRGYQECQLRNYHLLMKRRNEIYRLIPEYQQLENAVVTSSVERVRMLIDGENADLTEYRKKVAANAKRKEALLAEHGYPADYLEQIYACPDCQDTGYISGQKCHCFRKQEQMRALK